VRNPESGELVVCEKGVLIKAAEPLPNPASVI